MSTRLVRIVLALSLWAAVACPVSAAVIPSCVEVRTESNTVESSCVQSIVVPDGSLTDLGSAQVGLNVLSGGVLGTSGTQYLVWGQTGGVATESITANTQTLAGMAGAVNQLYCQLATAPGAGTSRTLTVRKNGVDTAMTLTIANTDVLGSQTGFSVTVATTDLLSLKSTVSGTPAASAVSCSLSGPAIAAITTSTTTDLTGLLIGNGTDVDAIANVAAGQVLTSGTPAAWSASPTVSNVTVSGTAGSEQAPALTAGNWTVGSGWESPIVGPGLIKNADGTGTQTPSAATTIVANTVYRVTFTVINWSVGNFSYVLGGNAGTASPGANGTFTQYVLTGTTGKLIITPTSTSRFTISAISIVPITEGAVTVDGTLTANSRLRVTGAASIGATVSPLPNTGLYINNANGPGLVVRAGSASGSRPIAVFQISNGNIAPYISEAGAFYSRGFMVLSGDHSVSLDSVGAVNIANSGTSDITAMFQARGDVNGSVVTAMSPAANTAFTYTGLDGGTPSNTAAGTANRRINWGVDYDGKLRWGASARSSTGFRVGSVTVTAAGSSCTSAPTITPSGGGCTSGGSYTSYVSGGTLQRVEIIEPAYGCTSAPALAVSGGGGCTATVSANLMDVSLERSAANTLSITGASGVGALKTEGGVIAGGTKFTISGCSAGTTVGGATAGTFVSGTTGTCTVVITLNGATGSTAPNGWVCAVNNLTTANLIRQTVSTTTTCTVEGVTVTNDVISFMAMQY